MSAVVGFWLALLLIYPVANGTAPGIIKIVRESLKVKK